MQIWEQVVKIWLSCPCSNRTILLTSLIMSFKKNGLKNSNGHNPSGYSQYSIQVFKILRTLLFEFSSYYTTLEQCVKDMQYCEHDGIQETGHVCVWPETWVFISHWVSSFLYSIGISWSLIHRHWALTNFKLRQLVVLGLN